MADHYASGRADLLRLIAQGANEIKPDWTEEQIKDYLERELSAVCARHFNIESDDFAAAKAFAEKVG